MNRRCWCVYTQGIEPYPPDVQPGVLPLHHMYMCKEVRGNAASLRSLMDFEWNKGVPSVKWTRQESNLHYPAGIARRSYHVSRTTIPQVARAALAFQAQMWEPGGDSLRPPVISRGINRISPYQGYQG